MMKFNCFLLIFALLFQSCVFGLKSRENRKKRKAQRKIVRAKELAPELFDVDTIVIRDTVVIEKTTIDTTTRVIYHDSITVVNNDRVVLKYFYDTLRHEIHHDVECKEIIKPIETRVEVPTFRMLTFWEKNAPFMNLFILIAIVSVLLALYFLRKNDYGYK